MNYNCSIFLDLRNLQEQIKKVFCYQKLSWLFTVWIIQKFCKFSAFSLGILKFCSITRTFFLTVGQTNFGNKIPYPWMTDAFFLRIKFLILQYCYLRFNKMIFSEIWQGKGNWTQLVDFIDIIVKNILFTYKICYLSIVCILNSVTR